MQIGVAFIPRDQALLCEENYLCLKLTGKKKKKNKNLVPCTTACVTRIAEELETQSSILEKQLTAFTKAMD